LISARKFNFGSLSRTQNVNMENLFNSDYMPIIIILTALWTIPWKGVSLWKAARNGSIVWFFILLIFNTLGILDMIYIFIFSKRSRTNADGKYN